MSSSANANISCLIALSWNLEKDSIIKLNPFLDNEEYSIHTINNQLSHTPLPDLDLHWKCQVFVWSQRTNTNNMSNASVTCWDNAWKVPNYRGRHHFLTIHFCFFVCCAPLIFRLKITSLVHSTHAQNNVCMTQSQSCEMWDVIGLLVKFTNIYQHFQLSKYNEIVAFLNKKSFSDVHLSLYSHPMKVCLPTLAFTRLYLKIHPWAPLYQISCIWWGTQPNLMQ